MCLDMFSFLDCIDNEGEGHGGREEERGGEKEETGCAGVQCEQQRAAGDK